MARFALRDLSRVEWGPTAKLAFARSLASALVITPLGVAFGGITLQSAVPMFLLFAVGLPIAAPLYMLMIKAMNGIFAAMNLGIAVLAGNILLFMVGAVAAVGDPIVYVVTRRFPQLLEVSDFKLFNLEPTLFVLRD